ncbi:hypothetical protein JCM10908_006019 [Rhodotorula pacifica]|uniref:uncharacterized protein n=1 Tax=Rhodotorula pacifica TaxID=1495444 RepID=UPI0031703680
MDPSFVPFQPSQVRRHRFCFCVPVRWGSWVLSALAAVISAMFAIAHFLALLSDDRGRPWMIVAEVAGVIVWSALVVICGFGWVGTIEQKRRWVEWYYELCWWHLWANVLFGFFGLLLLNLPGSRILATTACYTVGLAQEQLLHLAVKVSPEAAAAMAAQCQSKVSIGLILTDLAWTIAILIELWLTLVIGRYTDELADRDAAAQFGVDIENPNPPYRFAGIPPEQAEETYQRYRSAGKRSGKKSQQRRERR